jgi:leucyl aminopeptidase (aminopeptidase T)
VNAARRILEGSLSVVPGERVFIMVDRERAPLVPALQEVATLIGAKSDVIVLEDTGARPLHDLPKAIDEKLHQAQATILLAAFVEGEHPMRLALIERVHELGIRHAHMIGVGRRAMLAGFAVDPARILDTTRAVRVRMRPTSVLRARSAAGTDLTVELEPGHRWVEHVGVIRAGRWENLPTGELMTSPKNVNGVFVCDASLSGTIGAGGLLTRNPLRLEIKDMVVTNFSCSDSILQHGIESFLGNDRFARRVGTIFLGTNVGLLEPIGETVCDQNLPGLHISLGSTYADVTGAPFTTALYISLTSTGGDVDLDGAPLLRAGRYMI